MPRARTRPHLVERLADLGDGIRLRLLRLLEQEELSVGELASVLQLPQSTVSRHLKVLLSGEWVSKRTAGPAAYYRLTMDDLAPLDRQLWQTVRDQMGQGLEADEDSRRLRAALADRKNDSAGFFGRVAGQWDEVRTELFGDLFTTRGLLGLIRPDWVAADLGCGTGNASEILAPWVGRVIAVDASQAMLDAARQRLADHDNVSFVSGSVESLPIEDNSVDATICVLVLHHLPEPIQALTEMRRVLRTDRGGGVAVVIDMYEHTRTDYAEDMGHLHLGFDEQRITTMFSQAGFDSVRVVPLGTETAAKGPGLFAAIGRIDS